MSSDELNTKWLAEFKRRASEVDGCHPEMARHWHCPGCRAPLPGPYATRTFGAHLVTDTSVLGEKRYLYNCEESNEHAA